VSPPGTPPPAYPLSRLESGLILHSQWILALFVILTVVVTLATDQSTMPDFSDIYNTIGLQPMNAAGFAGVFALFLAVRPNRDEIFSITLLGLVLEIIYLQYLDPRFSLIGRLSVAGGGLFIAGLIGLAYRATMAVHKEDRWRARAMIRLALIIVFYPRFIGPVFVFLAYITPLVYDSHGLLVEGSLGFLPSFEMARGMAMNRSVGMFAMAIYSRLPLFMSIAFCLCLRNPKTTYANLYFGFLGVGLLGYAFYPLLPMVGIDIFIGTPPWPFGPIPDDFLLKAVPAPDKYPRTCFPSLHVTWILMIYFSVYRISKTINLTFLLIALWTMIGTVSASIGHYAVDWIPAFPFALANMAMTTVPTAGNKRLRIACIVFGLASTAGLALAIRWQALFFSHYPIVFWGGSLLIIVIAVLAERKLGTQTLAELHPAAEQA
jgi:hypothetical protein